MSLVANWVGGAKSLLTPSGTPGNQNETTTASYGVPVAILYGTHRLRGNVINSGAYFNTYAGYSMTFPITQVSLCEGPISEVLSVWLEKTKSTPGALGLDILTGVEVTAYSASTTYAVGDWVSSGGTNYVSIQAGNLDHAPASSPTWWSARGASATERAQSPWSGVGATALQLGYGGTALACGNSTFTFIATGELSRAAFEVSGRFTTATGSAQDVEPRSIIVDLLTNAEYGLALPTSIIDGYGISSGIPYGFTTGADGTAATSFTSWCQAKQLKLSLALEAPRSALEVVQEIALATNALPIWSEGKVKIRPLDLSYIAAAGGRPEYDGPSSAVPSYDLGTTGQDFLADPGQSSIEVERTALKEHFNCYPVEWSARSASRVDSNGAAITEDFNAYQATTEEGNPDPFDVATYGLRKAEKTVLRCITNRNHAYYIANALTQQSITARNQYRLRLGWRFGLLEPADYVTLTDAQLGLDRKLVRILELDEDQAGTISVVAEEVSTAAAVFPSLSAAIDPSPVTGDSSAPGPISVTSEWGTCVVTGGSGIYTYAWTRVSGAVMTLSSTTDASVTFTATVNGLVTAVYRCTVTDTVTSNTATADVTVRLTSG